MLLYVISELSKSVKSFVARKNMPANFDIKTCILSDQFWFFVHGSLAIVLFSIDWFDNFQISNYVLAYFLFLSVDMYYWSSFWQWKDVFLSSQVICTFSNLSTKIIRNMNRFCGWLFSRSSTNLLTSVFVFRSYSYKVLFFLLLLLYQILWLSSYWGHLQISLSLAWLIP